MERAQNWGSGDGVPGFPKIQKSGTGILGFENRQGGGREVRIPQLEFLLENQDFRKFSRSAKSEFLFPR